MGWFVSKSKKYNAYEKEFRGVKDKIKKIQEEMKEISYQREKESSEYENEIMFFALKETEWKQERNMLREENKILRKVLEDKEYRIREIEKVFDKENSSNELKVELRGESSGRRDETVEKWKQLYMAIKMELDHLIQRTHKYGLYWRAQEEDTAEKLKKELQTKDETVKQLNSRLTCTENELHKRERDVDILRQSLKIMSSKKAFQTNKRKQVSYRNLYRKLRIKAQLSLSSA